ncbi:hypothetical protein BCV69DRAFT_186633 [Microstroma glucosiphilum]|uniref:BHLH domain-containing protein n=1 Tax=Pseudomicrostroma glucosiphilum TaxID=1684307 RepID=A0A316U792_9BASI|nr:hypothetical protein BCV69DRAFT_186633 [Pseudomicrostroma glucosiphilum]PWN21116.1 hypothetical protein BCV69DRAFT_186633 [Pseudomicrostroma glucosiphilum]
MSRAMPALTPNVTTEEEQRSMYEQARQVFARMPHLPNHDAAAHALDRYSSRSTENGAGVDSASGEAQGEGADPTHTTSMILAEHQGGQSSQSMRHPSSNDRQQQYLPHHHKVATAAAITAMDDLSAHGHDGDVAALSERTRGYGSPERRSIRSHTDELGDEDNAHASGSSGRARSRKGKAAAVGGPETPETERQRKDLHKEVERKRRAGINSAIGELQSLVPDCNDKGVNKGDIILRAAAYIRELKNSEASNIEKWTLEKLLMDQALHDGQVQLEATRAEVERLREALGKEAESIPGTEEIVRDWGSHNHHSSTAEQHQSQRDAGQSPEVEHEEQQAPPVTLKAHGDGGNASSSTSDTITTAAIAPREGNSSAEDEAVRTAMIDNVDAVRLAAAVATVGPMGGGTGIAQTHLPSATDEEPLRTQVSPLIGERERVSSGSEEGNIFEESESNALEHTLGQLTGKRDHDDESVGQNAKVQKLTHLRDGEETKPGA